jgi:hypothetical protein
MQATGLSFNVSYGDSTVLVEVFADGRESLYRVHYPAESPFFAVKAFRSSVNPFWTSIPEGRQDLAEAFGALIDEYNETHSGMRLKPQGKKGGGAEQPTLF